jgi:Abnormal spindle-like microcephaly-assoc'd, ASPM-SPD-2-Hydin
MPFRDLSKPASYFENEAAGESCLATLYRRVFDAIAAGKWRHRERIERKFDPSIRELERGGEVNGTWAKRTQVEFALLAIAVVSLAGCQAVQKASSSSAPAAVPGALVGNPSSVAFGSVRAGSTQSKTDVLTNTSNSPIAISQATATGAGFSISGINAPLTLNGGQSLTYTITFAPSTVASSTGSVAISSSARNAMLNIALSGAGTAPGQLTVSPASINFGTVAVGSNQSSAATLTASGGSVTISSASSNNPEFSLTGLTFPITLAAGQSTSFKPTFAPQASGSTSGSISFVSNASNSAAQGETGTGVAAIQHSVSLSWSASTSAVIGYNVYRGIVSGGPYGQINLSLDPSTAYTDNTVQSGQTYFYVTTALDASNGESAHSNEVQAVIPLP